MLLAYIILLFLIRFSDKRTISIDLLESAISVKTKIFIWQTLKNSHINC